MDAWLADPDAAVRGPRQRRTIRHRDPPSRAPLASTEVDLDQPPDRAALGFGFELGLGFRTYVTASAPYLLLVALLLLAEPLPLFLLAGAAFGLGRFATAAARYVGADGDASSALVAARAALVRRSSAVVAAAGALVLLMA